jgi:hypothetical protein
MTPDPKWLEILKDSDDRLAVAVACGLFLLAAHLRWLPPLADWVLPAVWFGFLLFGCLWGVKLLNLIFQLLELLWLLIAKRR